MGTDRRTRDYRPSLLPLRPRIADTTMANVYTLLTLPQTSNGLTSFKSSVTGNNDDELTARKAPRLESDLDSASASRTSKGAPSVSTGPFQIKLVGYNGMPIPAHRLSALLKACALPSRAATGEGLLRSAQTLPPSPAEQEPHGISGAPAELCRNLRHVPRNGV